MLIELDENRGQAVVYEVTPDERSTDLAARGWARAGAWLALVERYGGRQAGLEYAQRLDRSARL